MGARPFGSKYFEDPSIARCCAVEYDRVWDRISRKVAEGEWFYRAREVVLVEEVPDMTRAFGAVVAQRVSKAIQHTDPERIPKWAKQAAKDHLRRSCEAHLLKTRGKISWINRLSLRLGGIPFW
jgi:hypothetical protein